MLGVVRGSDVAGGADSSGYISEAAAIAEGRLTKDVPLAREVPWPDAEGMFAPLGWRAGTAPGIIAPTYPPGYPLALAAARIAAGEGAMILVVAALAALAVWCTFVLGRRLDSPLTGLLAALLLATSPPFVLQALQPMSDVPATAWWVASVVLAARASPSAALGAGLCASMAVLTRPNLLPIAAAIGLYLASRDWLVPAPRRRTVVPLLFALPLALTGAFIAGVQNYLYGSPFTSGYGDAGVLYDVSNLNTNLHRYTRWLFASETRLVVAGLIAPIVLRRRRGAIPVDREQMRLAILGVAIALIVVASYLVYAQFESWTYLRYLLPAYPALFALAVLSFRRASASLGRRGSIAFTLAACAAILMTHVPYIRATDVLSVREGEQRYKRVAVYVTTRVLGRLAFIGLQHTGSLAYYTGSLTVRWDLLNETSLDEAVGELQKRGYRPLIVLEAWEEAAFRTRFAGEAFSRLDWAPRAEMRGPPTRMYDPSDRERYLAGQRWKVEEMK